MKSGPFSRRGLYWKKMRQLAIIIPEKIEKGQFGGLSSNHEDTVCMGSFKGGIFPNHAQSLLLLRGSLSKEHHWGSAWRKGTHWVGKSINISHSHRTASEISQTKTNVVCSSSHRESKKPSLIETESRTGVPKAWPVGGDITDEGILVRRARFPVSRWVSLGDLGKWILDFFTITITKW